MNDRPLDTMDDAAKDRLERELRELRLVCLKLHRKMGTYESSMAAELSNRVCAALGVH